MKKIVLLLLAALLSILSSCSKSVEASIEPTGEITSISEVPTKNLKIQSELWNGIYYGMKENDLLKEFPSLSLYDEKTYLMDDYQILEVPYKVKITLDDNRGVQYIGLNNKTQDWTVSPTSHSQSLIDLFTYKYGNDYSIDDKSKGEMTNKTYTWIHDKVLKIRVSFLFYSSPSVALGYPDFKQFLISYSYINTADTAKI